jgi:hypothetical protein
MVANNGRSEAIELLQVCAVEEVFQRERRLLYDLTVRLHNISHYCTTVIYQENLSSHPAKLICRAFGVLENKL